MDMIMSKKKPVFPISDTLRTYLEDYDREEDIALTYDDMKRWSESLPVLDNDGNDTLWRSVMYPQSDQTEIFNGLREIYALLKTDGDMNIINHLSISRIEYCLFGNSNPFRIKIVNMMNDNHDYFYIKKADASRVYGLELEHIMSPNRISYIIDGDTLVEDHIAGIPGDVFIESYMDNNPNFYAVGMAKEFVKFNERCFIMLLGDMRSYNYVVDITPDFDKEQYRTRTIDFDQLCYEGRMNFYKPQYYKENRKIVSFCMETLSHETVAQYQHEERSLMKKRYHVEKNRITQLLESLSLDNLSTHEKRTSLIKDLNKYHNTTKFSNCQTMGEVLRIHLDLMLGKPKPKKLKVRAVYKVEGSSSVD